MSLRPDGTYRCDRCGIDVDNAGYQFAVNISGADPADVSVPRRLHLCVARVDDNGATVPGCQDAVLNEDALADYYKSKG